VILIRGMDEKTKTTSAPNDPLIGLTVSGATLARLLGVSGKTIYELDKSNVIKRATKGNYVLESSVRGYCEHIRHPKSEKN
jgi:hypothetical protein